MSRILLYGLLLLPGSFKTSYRITSYNVCYTKLLRIIQNIVFVIEFKVGEKDYLFSNYEQVWDYALDLKNFHKPSHDVVIVPILLATEAKVSEFQFIEDSHNDNLVRPLKSNKDELREIIRQCLEKFKKFRITSYNVCYTKLLRTSNSLSS